MAEQEAFGLPDSRYTSVPLEEMNCSFFEKITAYLNSPGCLIGDHMNDYTGLAELVGFSNPEINMFARQSNPTSELFLSWIRKKELHPDLGQLWNYLKIMERIDILHDMKSTMVDCAKGYIENQQNSKRIPNPTETTPKPDIVKYDAFVVWACGPREVRFLSEMKEWLEDKYNLRLYIPERDDTPKETTVEADATVMRNRCKRCIVLLSTFFHQCPRSDRLLKLAKSISPGAKSKFLIPVIIEKDCRVPLFLGDLEFCDFSTDVEPEWNWRRLYCVITARNTIPKIVADSQSIVSNATISEKSIEVNTANQQHRYGSSAAQTTAVLTISPERTDRQTCVLQTANSENPNKLNATSQHHRQKTETPVTTTFTKQTETQTSVFKPATLEKNVTIEQRRGNSACSSNSSSRKQKNGEAHNPQTSRLSLKTIFKHFWSKHHMPKNKQNSKVLSNNSEPSTVTDEDFVVVDHNDVIKITNSSSRAITNCIRTRNHAATEIVDNGRENLSKVQHIRPPIPVAVQNLSTSTDCNNGFVNGTVSDTDLRQRECNDMPKSEMPIATEKSDSSTVHEEQHGGDAMFNFGLDDAVESVSSDDECVKEPEHTLHELVDRGGHIPPLIVKSLGMSPDTISKREHPNIIFDKLLRLKSKSDYESDPVYV